MLLACEVLLLQIIIHSEPALNKLVGKDSLWALFVREENKGHIHEW